jgi:hypothetical protein
MWAPILVAVGLGGLMAGYGLRSFHYTAAAYSEGLGFHHRIWRESQTIARLASLSPDTPIYSNAPEAIYLFTGRPAMALPRHTHSMAGEANASFAVEMADLRRSVDDEGAVIALLDAVKSSSSPSMAQLDLALGPLRAERTPDGVILTQTAP